MLNQVPKINARTMGKYDRTTLTERLLHTHVLQQNTAWLLQTVYPIYQHHGTGIVVRQC
jgi:hypothetical protein